VEGQGTIKMSSREYVANWVRKITVLAALGMEIGLEDRES
jgi:hypothetical protein